MPLEIAKLSRRYADQWVLRDVDLTAPEGRIFGVCGGTASGKTTLLNAIAGSGKLNGGRITLDGRDITTARPRDRGVSLVTDREASGILGIFDSSQKGSSGERQLESFRKALASAERVLLLDDPFDQMEPGLREECFEALRGAAADRIVIFASSDFEQVVAVADETAMLIDTYVGQTGTPRQIYENPETVKAARLSGDNNLFLARRLTSTDADLPEFQTIDGSHRVFARPVEKARLGAINQNVTLAIRPEQVSISMGASFPEDNLLRAVVIGIRFRGATSVIEFDAGGLSLRARVFKVVGLNVGDECMLGLPPDRILVLKG